MMKLLTGDRLGARFAAEVLAELPVSAEDLPALMTAYSFWGDEHLLQVITRFDEPELAAFLVDEANSDAERPGLLLALAKQGPRGARLILDAVRKRPTATGACGALTLMGEQAHVIEPELVELADRAQDGWDMDGALTLLSCIEPLHVPASKLEALAQRRKGYLVGTRLLVRARSAQGVGLVRDAIDAGVPLLLLLGHMGEPARVFEPEAIAQLPNRDAIALLGEIAGAQGIAALTAQLDNEDDWLVPWLAAESLVRLGAHSALPHLEHRTHWFPPTERCLSIAVAALKSGRTDARCPRISAAMADEWRPRVRPPAREDPGQLNADQLRPWMVSWRGEHFPATMGRRVGQQLLLGANHGEFGSVALVDHAQERPLLDDPVFRLLEFSGIPIIVTDAALFRVVDLDGLPRAVWWHRLPGAPRAAFVTVANELFISCGDGDVLVSANGAMRLAARSRRQSH
jgi:hypothetical protein